MAELGTVGLQSEAIVSRETLDPSFIYTYLAGADTLRGGPQEFPSVLDLELFEEYMRGLDGQRLTVSQEFDVGGEALGLRPFHIEGEGEVAQSIYFDTETGSIQTTDLRRGGLSSVTSSFYDAVQEGRVPLVEMHTHSGMAAPSVSDFQFMLLGDPQSKWRGIRAIAVLCPQTQILALATAETPILVPDQLDQLLLEHGETNRQYEGKEGRYLKTLLNRTKRIGGFQVKHIEYEIAEKVKEWQDKLSQGVELEDKDKKPSDQYTKISDKANRAHAKAYAKYSKYLYRVYNRLQLQFAKDMKIKLYFSDDFRNFVALPE